MRVSPCTHRSIKNRIYKVLLGTTVTIRNKRYRTAGLIKRFNGEILSRGVYIIPSERLIDLMEKLREKKLESYVEILKICLCACNSQH